MRSFFILAIAMFACTLGSAQESGVYTQYHLNPVLLNPGATGQSGDHEFLFNYRNKWADFEGAPRSFTFMYHGGIGERVGIGGQLFSEQIGRFRSFQGTASYAYRIRSGAYDIGIGLSTGIQQIRLSSEFDPFLDETDELLNEALDGVILFDASFGIYGEYDDAFFFGLSFPNLVRSRLADIQGDVEFEDDEFNFAALLGYRFDIQNYNFTVEPSIAVKNIRRVPFHIDLNLKLSFLEEQLVGGITYSISEDEQSRFGVLLGTRIDELRIFYGYDVGLGAFQDFNNGSHELTLRYTLLKQPASESRE